MSPVHLNPSRFGALRSRLGRVAALALIAAAPPLAAAPPATPSADRTEPAVGANVTVAWSVRDAVATVALDHRALAALGLSVTDVASGVAGHEGHHLSVIPRGTPAYRSTGTLETTMGWDGFRGFAGGVLRPAGGFKWQAAGRNAESFDFSSFELKPAAEKSTELDLYDAKGRALLTTEHAQWLFDAENRRLRYLNATLKILPELARRLGDERYTGVGVGVLDIDFDLAGAALPTVDVPEIDAPPPCGDWSGNVDVGLTNMSSIGQAGIATVNGRSVVVVLPSADLRNVGTANVPWYSKFTNLGVPPWNDQHPFLVWQMTRRSSDGSFFEPLGKSDLKHAFLTINSGCDAGACTDSHVLGSGCSDVYGTSTNNSVGSLAPRNEVTASTGIWAHCGGIPSHFDTNGDCSQDFSGAGENSFTHGLKAAETDLQVAGASYFVEAFYVVRNDVNIFNSMGYRQVAPAKVGSTWTFPTVGAYTQGPPINAWVNPTSPGADADNETIDVPTGQGHVQLAVKVTDVSGSPGRKRYAYALQNHDFDRQIKSFHIPFDPTGATVTNIVYADGDGFAANDWTATTDSTGITWTAPASTTPPAELDYATVVAFRFDVDRNPIAANASLGVFEVGSPTDLTIASLGPTAGGAPVNPGSFFSVTPCRLVDTRSPNAPSLTPGVARGFAGAGACGIPSTAKALALNVTAIAPVSTGHLVVYAGTVPTTASLNYNAGTTRANNMIVVLENDGTFKLLATQGAGTLDVAVDVTGYFE